MMRSQMKLLIKKRFAILWKEFVFQYALFSIIFEKINEIKTNLIIARKIKSFSNMGINLAQSSNDNATRHL